MELFVVAVVAAVVRKGNREKMINLNLKWFLFPINNKLLLLLLLLLLLFLLFLFLGEEGKGGINNVFVVASIKIISL